MEISSSLSLTNASTSSGRDPKEIKKAAQDFEALLIAGMLKMVRESSSLDKSGPGESDPAGATALEMAEEQLSRTLAQNGGIGLSSLLARGLSVPSPLDSKNAGTIDASSVK